MQPVNEKIKLYAVREFGQRLSVVMDFLRQNWKPLLVYLTYFLLPLSLLQGLSLNSFMGGYTDILSGISRNAQEPTAAGIVQFILSLLAFISLYMVGAVLLYGVVYGYMRIYERGDGQITSLTWAELKPDFWFSVKRSVRLMLAGIVIGFALLLVLGALMGLAVAITPALVLLPYLIFILAIIALAPPLSLITPAYIFEDGQTLVGSIKKGLRLGFGTWGGTVGVMFILSFIINIVTQFTALPWTLMFIVKMVFGLGIDGLDGTWTENVFYTFGYYLTAVLQCFTSYVASTGLIVGAAYLYGHAAEKMDGITVEDNIRNFGNLGATN